MSGFIPLPWAQCHQCNWTIDGYGHEDYIRRIAKSRRIPSPDACWECHQPPLYYLAAAVVYRIAARFPSRDPFKAVGVLSILFAVGFLIFGERVLRLEITQRPVYYVCLCLLVFWPLQTVLANRIGNDVPYYLADAGALYYVMRWRRDLTASSLAGAVLWCGIAMAFKYTAFITLPFVACIIAVQCYRNRVLIGQIRAKPVFVAVCLALTLAAPAMVRTYRFYRIEHQSSVPLLVPTVPGLVQSMGVSNDRLRYFLLPEIAYYEASPFLGQGPGHDELRYFVNYVMKTSLFGFVIWTPYISAYILNALLWSLFAYLVWWLGVITVRDRSWLSESWPLMLFAASHVVALAMYRLWYPHLGNQDFRFVYSAVIPMAALYGTCLSWHRAHQHRYHYLSGMTLAAAFVATSIGFILLSNLA
jgi:hypothetical protein